MQARHTSVSAYVRANFAFWAKRWVAALLFVSAITVGLKIRGPADVLPSIGAVVMVVLLALTVVLASLTVAGFLHVRGYVSPKWQTKERGALASFAAYVLGLLIIVGLMWIYGM